MDTFDEIGRQAIWFFVGALTVIVFLLGGLLYMGRRVSLTRGAVSPYSKKPMTLGVDISFSVARYVSDYMRGLPQPENPVFDISKAAICEETGRIFPDAVTRGEIVKLDWGFLKKRYPGNWISWGSVPEITRAVIKLCHRDIGRFQLEKSSPEVLPERIDSFYAFVKPGPLYVDVATKTLLGWQSVPGTPFEVLVVKKPDFESIDQTF